MDDEIKYDIVIIDDPINYSPFAFGSAFANIQYYLYDKLYKTQRSLEEYFKLYGCITDHNGNTFKFDSVESDMIGNEIMYHLNFKKN